MEETSLFHYLCRIILKQRIYLKNMKKKSLFAALILVAAIASFQWSAKRKNLDSLMLENIEALAEGEENVDVACFDIGSVDCPYTNIKVYFIYEPTDYALR